MPRKALVIGNRRYEAAYALANASNDAVAISAAFRRNGIEVVEHIDLKSNEMDAAARQFAASLERDGAGIFYFAGHGVQIDGINYLVGIDADPSDEVSTTYHSLKLDYMVSLMDRAGSEANILILDACRNNPWGSGWTRSVGIGGFAPVSAPRGTLIAFSTSPGQKSLDGTGLNGRYTEALLQHIDSVCPVETMFKRVRATLAAASTNKQIPWEHTSLVAEFFFNRSRNVPTTMYSDQAIKDGTFVADPSRPAHVILNGLRSNTWDTQNQAASRLTAATLGTFSENECFMMGRALYSAADGNAWTAQTWTTSFASTTSGVIPANRKAVLDGMLFEVFFGRDGVLRELPKARFLDDLFDLAQPPEFRPSFEFVADILMETGKVFHAFPDFDSDISVNVLTRTDADKPAPAVTGIIIGGRNILIDSDTSGENDTPIYSLSSEAAFRSRLSMEAAVPTSRQIVHYPDLAEPPDRLRIPYGYSFQWAI